MHVQLTIMTRSRGEGSRGYFLLVDQARRLHQRRLLSQRANGLYAAVLVDETSNNRNEDNRQDDGPMKDSEG